MSAMIGFHRSLPQHPQSLPSSSFSFAWLEAPLKACIARLADVPDWKNIDLWPAGRVFGEAGEYRWQRTGERSIHAVMLVEHGPFPDDSPVWQPQELKQQRGDSALILWGTWVKPEKDSRENPHGNALFYANEIPQMQTYPIDLDGPVRDEQTPRLIVRRYCATNGEMGEFIRCVGFALCDRE